jgi:hypothetical protein
VPEVVLGQLVPGRRPDPLDLQHSSRHTNNAESAPGLVR